MKYNTPELLLVGAAQNLVQLIEPLGSGAPGCQFDNNVDPYSDLAELW